MRLDTSVKVSGQFFLTQAMRQALEVLQMPVMDLSTWLLEEIEHNPLLEIKEKMGDHEKLYEETQELNFDTPTFAIFDDFDDSFREALFPEETSFETQSSTRISLFDHLMRQAHIAFRISSELRTAEWIIGNLDENGLCGIPIQEESLHILQVIQTFDPPGVAARTMQESLLIQLKNLGKENHLISIIIRDHFDDFLHFRIAALAKKLKIPQLQIRSTIQGEITCCTLSPTSHFNAPQGRDLIPDVAVVNEDGKWQIVFNEQPLPKFQWRVLDIKRLSPEERAQLRPYQISGKWLIRNLEKRRRTLGRIIQFLLERQSKFFLEESKIPAPLTLAETAYSLHLHESTIARAVNSKHIASPRGVFPLRFFFAQPSLSIHEELERLIAQENKSKPYTDQQLSQELGKKGIVCARRTITKYRRLLKISSVHLRKQQ